MGSHMSADGSCYDTKSNRWWGAPPDDILNAARIIAAADSASLELIKELCSRLIERVNDSDSRCADKPFSTEETEILIDQVGLGTFEGWKGKDPWFADTNEPLAEQAARAVEMLKHARQQTFPDEV